MNFSAVRKKFKFSNLLNGLFIITILIMVFNPSAKALLIRSLMKVGLFQPDLPRSTKTTASISLPNISFKTVDGETLHLVNLKGKVIFINFWATWCPPCIAEMPSINKLYEKLKDNKNIVFIMVDADHDFSKSVPFINKRQFNFPLFEGSSTIPESLFGGALPTTVIFDKNGQKVFHQEGTGDYSNEKVIAYLLKLSQ